jgi:AraC-like DNA-binding protein
MGPEWRFIPVDSSTGTGLAQSAWKQCRFCSTNACWLMPFLQGCFAKVGSPTPARAPSWLAAVRGAISVDAISTAQLARQLHLHPAWLARAYLHATGESIQATIRRYKVERAMGLIRRTRLPLAQIAAEAGFCDQSHMVRSFHAVLGRAPNAVRAVSYRVA